MTSIAVSDVNFTGMTEVDALLFGSKWDLAAGVTLSYSFLGLGSLWDLSYNYGTGTEPGTGFAPLSTSAQQAVRDALASWSSVANLAFQEVADDASGHGTLRLGYTTLGMDASQLGYTYAPTGSDYGGDVWLNATLKDSLYASFNPGGLSSYVVLHELGHALGLKHPHAQSAANSATLDSLEDSLFNSVMSYYTWPGVALTQTNIDRLPSTPMALDIDALQALYGANVTYHNGDDSYRYAADGKYFETIFDTGGNDTIEFAGSSAAEIDLRPGEWSQLGVPVQINGGTIQSADTVRIYRDSLIENAIGGEASDHLIGNNLANQLNGDAGNDTLEGGAGKDTLTGGTGADTYVLSAEGEDTIADISAGQGDRLDVAYLTQGLLGYSAGENPFASGYLKLSQVGSDTLLRYDRDGAGSVYTSLALARLLNTDAAGFNPSSFVQAYDPQVAPQYALGLTLVGTSGDDALDGGVYDDVISGLGGNDTISGSGGADYIDGGDGADQIRGGPGNDTILGGNDADNMEGDAGNDSIDGGPGNDYLSYYWVNGQGNDTLIGGVGNDDFWINSGSAGYALVLEGGEGADKIQVMASPQTLITLTGGGGQDLFSWVKYYGTLTGNTVFTDFQAGAAGDWINVDALLDQSATGANGYSGGNPFNTALAYLQLVQQGTDTLLQWDQDGAGGTAHAWQTVLSFQNLLKESITSDNFVGKFILGTEGNDDLKGEWTNDTLQGLGGDDSLDGGEGDDVMEGGGGDDVYRIDRLGDIVSEIAGAGNADKVRAAIEDYHLAAEIEDLDLELGVARGHGNDKANHIKGNSGDNVLDGKQGADRMEGGQGADTYYVDDSGDVVYEADNTPSGSSGLKLGLDLGSIIDTVIASVSYTLTNYVERLTLATGTAALSGTGNDLDNLLTGNAGNNTLIGGLGNDTIDGGSGTDAATFAGNRSAYSITQTAGGYVVTDINATDGDEGSDTLIGIERMVFANLVEILATDVDFLAYHWKSHHLLAGVDISDNSHVASTDGAGGASFAGVTYSPLTLSVTRAVSTEEADITSTAVNLQDAIAILKMIVGLEVNGAGKALSPYQALAADFDGNGQVQLTDAIGVLKHVVGLTAPAPVWHFANETDAAIPTISALNPGAAPAISVDLSSAVSPEHVGLVAYLSGDVDGSYAGVAGSLDLDEAQPDYFSNLTQSQGLNPAQFGIYA